MNRPQTSDFARLGSTGHIVRRDCVGAILAANLGSASIVVVAGQAVPVDMKPEAVLAAITDDQGGLDLTDEEARRLDDAARRNGSGLVFPGEG